MGKRVDQNQSEIVQIIRAIGAEWIPTSGDPKIGFDGIVLFRGRSLVAEIKNGALPPSQRKLTPNELKRQQQCEAKGVPYLIFLSPAQAVEVLSEFR